MSTYSDASLILPVAPEKKAGKIYSLKPTDGSGDFDFTRSGEATRINKDGLIETVASNVPRLNYPLIDGVVSGCPSLLLEPQRINLVTYSEDFTQSAWVKTRVSISSNVVVSPDGTLTADKIISDATLNSHFIRDDISSTIGVVSVFAKADEFTFLKLSTNAFGFQASYFDLVNGTFVESADHIAKIEDYGNGWFRCSIYVSAAFTQFYVENAGNSASATHLGDGTSGIYIWGAQVEAGSYPTSYIPTSGSSVTRSAETCNNAGDVNTFNDSEGVLFAEISNPKGNNSAKFISLSNYPTSNKEVFIGFLNRTAISFQVYDGTTALSGAFAITDNGETHKIALSYVNLGNLKLYVDGVLVVTNTSNTINFSSGDLTTMRLTDRSGTNIFYGNTKQIQYFPTALNDTSLEELTSWRSFNEMARELLYTIL
jgi:hypothetical protein